MSDKDISPEHSADGQVQLKLLDSSKSDNSALELLCDNDRVVAFIRITTLADNAAPSAEEVKSFLLEKGVQLAELAEKNIASAVASARAKGTVGPALVARGRKPEDGKDGVVKWLVRRGDESAGRAAAGARVDYKERNVITNITRGQKILTISEPTAGTPGMDIFGNELPCRPGQPADARRGKNVDVSEDGKTFMAACAGYLDQTGVVVAVEPVLTVKGDVDLSVGNIDFVGPVKVSGDILDGFHVRSAEDIDVSGMVEGAFLDAGKCISVTGGVAGKGKGRVTCKGAFEARYLNDVYVETDGEIKVHNSIVNSTVKSLGRIDVLSGGIKGANVVARDGLRSPEIGSDLGVRTIVVVGMDYDLKDRLVTVEREMGVVKQTMYKIEAALGPIASQPEMVSRLADEKAQVAKKLIAQRDKLREHHKRLSAARDDVLTRMQVNEGVWVEVAKAIFPGVVMQIGTCRRTFEVEVAGPVKLCPDLENGTILVRR